MLTLEEQQTIESRLGRKPSDTELAVFDAMWSEHCSYKSSKKYIYERHYKTSNTIHNTLI